MAGVKKPLATVFNIQRVSTEDGPGLRTTLFLKGCNLRCAWCHNPEGIDARPVVQWNKARCVSSQITAGQRHIIN